MDQGQFRSSKRQAPKQGHNVGSESIQGTEWETSYNAREGQSWFDTFLLSLLLLSMLSPSASCPELCVNWAVKLNHVKNQRVQTTFFFLALVFLIWVNSLICLTVQLCCYKSGTAAKGFDLYVYHLSSFESGPRGGCSFIDFDARMISSNHLAWPVTLSHEFCPIVLP